MWLATTSTDTAPSKPPAYLACSPFHGAYTVQTGSGPQCVVPKTLMQQVRFSKAPYVLSESLSLSQLQAHEPSQHVTLHHKHTKGGCKSA